LTIQSKTHDLYGCGAELAPAIGLDSETGAHDQQPRRRLLCLFDHLQHFALAGVAVMALDMPVSMTLSYEEHQHMTGKRSATWSNGRIAVGEDGKIQAVEYDVALDHGAYAGTSSIVFGNMVSVAFSGYNIPTPKSWPAAALQPCLHLRLPRIRRAADLYHIESLIDMAAEKAASTPGIPLYQCGPSRRHHLNCRPYQSYCIPAAAGDDQTLL
jgi:aldehyde oxidoreductase